MIFTIREYTDNSVIVDYEDGSWAEVPLDSPGQLNDPAHLAETIEQYGPVSAKPPVAWIDNAAIPAGTVVNTDDPEYQVAVLPEPEPELITYEEARLALYPSNTDQWDADYWTRHGRPEDQVLIDQQIAWVKETIPKDWEARTREEFVRFMEDLEIPEEYSASERT